MRKIPHEIENPIDNLYMDFADSTLQYYKKLDFTPNGITTLSLMFGLLSAGYLYYDNRILSAFFLLISYYFDCTDGAYARKYDMVTGFGDVYDHTADNLKLFLILFILYRKNPEKFFKFSPIILFCIIITFVHLGCQEKIYDKPEHSPMLKHYSNFCPGNPFSIMPFTRYLSAGTGTILLVGLILIF